MTKRNAIKPGLIVRIRGKNPPTVTKLTVTRPRPGLNEEQVEPGPTRRKDGASSTSCASLGPGPRRYKRYLPGRHRTRRQWLHVNRTVNCTTAANGDLEILKWIHDHRSEGCTTAAIDDAAAGGHLKVLRWLHVNRSERCSLAALDGASTGGHIGVVQWHIANFTDQNIMSAMGWALNNDHFDEVLFLHTQHGDGYCLHELEIMRSMLQWSPFEPSFLELRAWNNERDPYSTSTSTLGHFQNYVA
ncbi:hypothetical protein JG687_00018566 [Phytophthora cactorum]|uniref:Ankyrin repeat-containing domain n=1 Tax=Phytophthora cactorum TaxID=29920 RepID=A0A8T1TQB3_9STRA|nr:hypothetical protein JG687_00018566 [Phytophthora cactorum]